MVLKPSKQIRDRFNVAKYYSERLVRTETNHFNNEADALAYEEMGVNKYVFVATLDSRTSKACQDMDNEVIEYKERKIGFNFPPLHPNCRSKTRGYLGKEAEKMIKRRAFNQITGKAEQIDNISYGEWLNKFTNSKHNGIISANSESISDKLISKITFLEKKNYTKIENIRNDLVKYEREIVNKKVENAVVIDKKGNSYLVESKSTNSVNIKDLGPETLKGSYMTHNHPDNETRYSFSSYDISEFMNTDIELLRGVDYKYAYEIERTLDTVSVNGDIILYEFSNDLRYEALEKIIEDNLDADEEEYHIINQLLAKKYKYKYRRIPREK